MAVNRLWYPDRMLSRSRANQPNCHRIPGAVQSCLQWQDVDQPVKVKSKVSTTTTTTTTKTMEPQQQHQQLHPQPARPPMLYVDSASQTLGNRSGLAQSRPHYRHLPTAVGFDDVERTTWTTLDGERVAEDDVIDAVHRVTSQPSTCWNATVGDRFTDQRRYNTLPPQPPCRSALRRPVSSTRRWVDVHEDEHGRAVDVAVVRPVTPSNRRLGGHRVEFADEYPPDSCHDQSSRPTTSWLRRTRSLPSPVRARRWHQHDDGVHQKSPDALDHDEESARQALLAIYQAGKPDMMFHSRAPSSTALETMLKAVAEKNRAQDALVKYQSMMARSKGRRPPSGHYLNNNIRDCYDVTTDSGDVADDDKPVKVKVECPPHSDTVFSFRVQSKAA